jgi:hypothetical protein
VSTQGSPIRRGIDPSTSDADLATNGGEGTDPATSDVHLATKGSEGTDLASTDADPTTTAARAQI